MIALSGDNTRLVEMGIDPKKELIKAKNVLTHGCANTIFTERGIGHLTREVVMKAFQKEVSKKTFTINPWVNCTKMDGIIIQSKYNSHQHNDDYETHEYEFLNLRMINKSITVTGATFTWREKLNTENQIIQFSSIQIVRFDTELTIFDILRNHGRHAQLIGDTLGWSTMGSSCLLWQASLA